MWGTKFIFFTLLIVGLGIFYWSELRPYIVHRSCMTEAAEERERLEAKYETEPSYILRNGYINDGVEDKYKFCMFKHGIYPNRFAE